MKLGRKRYAQSKNRQNHKEPSQGTGNTHIEDLLAGAEGRSNPNHCTKSSKRIEKGRGRNDIGQGAADAVETAGQIMPHLMSQQDRQQRQREGQALEESQRILKGIE